MYVCSLLLKSMVLKLIMHVYVATYITLAMHIAVQMLTKYNVNVNIMYIMLTKLASA